MISTFLYIIGWWIWMVDMGGWIWMVDMGGWSTRPPIPRNRSQRMSDKVLHLHQYGRDGYDKTRGRIYKAIATGEEFKSGNLEGSFVTDDDGNGEWLDTGRLPSEWMEVFKQLPMDFAVYSYNTPIAWHVPAVRFDDRDIDEHWVMPDVRYSATTTRHQSIVRVALSLANVRTTL